MKPIRLRLLFCIAATLATASAATAADTSETIDFDGQVRPILSDKCFRCHGPDEAARESGLRLDLREQAISPADSGEQAIVPGRPENSRLVARILSEDSSEVMPPPEVGKPLTDAEKDVLTRWVAQGAEYRAHWSFVTPVRPALPAVTNNAWVRNDIDRFVLARLESEGLEPAEEANRTTLIRRVTLDLTGLPPTPAEIDAFLADDSANAYEKIVDRLLASPHYGERMAVDWLDAARYADTHGYHIDSGRDMTAWREWVIEAFNQNKPFDAFTVEQIAGDLLPGASIDQRIASGFNRNHMINFEGGAIPEEYHTAYIIDRVNTTGTVWLGLTIGCAQCHDHKYDPISQRDYYGLYAFFHNVPEKGLDGISGNAAPLLQLPNDEQKQKLAHLEGEIARLERALSEPDDELDREQSNWEAALASGDVEWTLLTGDSQRRGTTIAASGGEKIEVLKDGTVRVSGKNPASSVYSVSFDALPVTGFRFEMLPDESLAGAGPGRSDNGNVVLTDVRVRYGDGSSESMTAKFRSATADFSQLDFAIDRAIDGDLESGWAIYPEVGKAHSAVFELEHAVPSSRMTIDFAFESKFARHQPGRFRVSTTTSKQVRPRESLPEAVRKALNVASDKRTDQDRATLRDHFRRQVAAATRDVAGQVAKLKQQLDALKAEIPTAMVMQELPSPRDTFVLMRGEYDKKGEQVAAGVPAALPPLPQNASRDRLGLAEWLVSPNHPLTSRVTVNRYWQMFFGIGLVKTSEDFGLQGDPPSHPELLNWLACEFIAGPQDQATGETPSAWDVRALIRLIVTSATYRQASAVSREAYDNDPENRLLARGPRFRLQAEFLRDQALAVSGLLSPRIGGASVSPYQPPGLWEELMSREDGARFSAQSYEQSHGEDLYRRTMYTFWKRTCPPPTLATFDAPDRETCTVRRARTNTPLQALVLLNDPTYVEASRKLAERVLKGVSDSDDARITFAFRLTTARTPTDAESEVIRSMLTDQLERYRRDVRAAEQLLSVGESPKDGGLDAAEVAAWTTICNAILNLDETVTRN